MNQGAIKKAAEELAANMIRPQDEYQLRDSINNFALAIAAAMEPQKHDADGSDTDRRMRQIAEQQRDEAVKLLRRARHQARFQINNPVMTDIDAFLARIDGGGK